MFIVNCSHYIVSTSILTFSIICKDCVGSKLLCFCSFSWICVYAKWRKQNFLISLFLKLFHLHFFLLIGNIHIFTKESVGLSVCMCWCWHLGFTWKIFVLHLLWKIPSTLYCQLRFNCYALNNTETMLFDSKC